MCECQWLDGAPVSRLVVPLGDEQVGHLHEEPLADAVVWIVLTVRVAPKPVDKQSFKLIF